MENAKLRQARERLPSPTRPGEPMSLAEAAAIVSSVLYGAQAAHSSFTGNYLGKVERGVIGTPGPEYRAALRTAYGAASDDELGFPRERTPRQRPDSRSTANPGGDRVKPSPTDDQAGQDILSDQPGVRTQSGAAAHREEAAAVNSADLDRLRRRTSQVLAGAAVSSTFLEDWERTAAEHGQATRTRAAPDLLIELREDFAELSGQLGLRHSSRALRRLTRVAAQMSGLMFLTLIKMEQRQAARSWARTARVAADEADDGALRSWVRAQEAYVHYYSGNLHEAVSVAQHAQALTGTDASVGLCLALAIEARTHANLRAADAARACIGQAEAALASLDIEDVIASAFGYNEAQLRFHEGNTLTILGDTDSARSAQSRALELYPPSDYLDRALVELDRAQCHVHDHDLTAATAAVENAASGLTPAQRQGLVQSRTLEIFTSLPPSERQARIGRELYDLATA